MYYSNGSPSHTGAIVGTSIIYATHYSSSFRVLTAVCCPSVHLLTGGVVGGVVGLALLAGTIFWYIRSRKHHEDMPTGPVDLASTMEGQNPGTVWHTTPYPYSPAPHSPPPDSPPTAHQTFLPSMQEYRSPYGIYPQTSLQHSGPRTTSSSSDYGYGSSGDHPMQPQGLPQSSSGARKLPIPPRQVTVLQHTDGGEMSDGRGESSFQEPPQIVEVPPAYSSPRI